MKLFGKKKEPEPPATQFDPAAFEPVIRSSICTGERVACMRERDTGRLHELMLIRSPGELEAVCEANGIAAEDLRKIY